MMSSVFGQLIAMVTSIIMGRILGVERLGTYTFAMTMSAIIFIFLNFGLSGILQRHISQDRSSAGKLYANTLFLRFCIAIPVSLILSLVIAYILGRTNEIDIILLGCLYTGLNGIFTIVGGGITATEQFKMSFVFSIIQKTGILLTTIIALLATKDIAVMLILHDVVFLVLIFVVLVYINKNLCKIYFEADWPFITKYIKEALPQIFSAAAEYINLRSDLLVLSVMVNDAATGLYSVASNIYIAASFIPLAIAKAATPTFNRVLGAGENPKHIVNRTFEVIIIISACLCFGVIILAKFGILLLWGSEFESSIVLLRILSLSLLFMPMNRFFGYILVGIRRQDIVAKCTITGAALNLIGNIFLVPLVGISAVAFTTIATEFVITTIEYVFIRKTTDYLRFR
jgi:O-antigen/teichoic acid export membrane protein